MKTSPNYKGCFLVTFQGFDDKSKKYMDAHRWVHILSIYINILSFIDIPIRTFNTNLSSEKLWEPCFKSLLVELICVFG
jgi:hypothetical protein